jgi:hypothetical protein
MLTNPQLSWTALAAFSRSMSRMMEAGVEVRKSLQTSSRQSADRRMAGAIENVVVSVASGRTLSEAFEREGELFPPLFRDLVNVGEQTGSVPEVFNALAKYYDSRIKQVKDFRAAIAWPVIQLVAAICIIGLLVFILGILPAGENGQPFDVLGLRIVWSNRRRSLVHGMDWCGSGGFRCLEDGQQQHCVAGCSASGVAGTAGDRSVHAIVCDFSLLLVLRIDAAGGDVD